MPLTAAQKIILFGGQTYSQKVARIAPANLIGWWKQTENYSPVAGTGTIAQTLTAVLGVGTAFLSQLQIGDLLVGTGISGYITAIADDTHLTLSSSTTVGASSFTYTRQISIDSSKELNNGLYRNVTLGQPGIGDGLTAASYDGTTSFDNIYSAALNADFNNQEGTVAAWAKMSAAGVWTDGTQRSVVRLGADNNNFVIIDRSTTNNELRFRYTAGGTAIAVATTAFGGSLAWLSLACTWSKSGDAFKAYVNGLQVGTTQTGLGVWAGALGATVNNLGAGTTGPATPWSGLLAHAMLWNTPLTAAQALALATVA